MKMTCVMDDIGKHGTLEHEHGLSILVRTGEHTILFDTGASPRLLRNMVSLGIDPMAIDYIVVSHGHNDHSGGLQAFSGFNHRAPVFVGEGFSRPRYHQSEHGYVDIGYPARDRIIEIEDRLNVVTSVVEFDTGMYLIPAVTLKKPESMHNEGLFVEQDGRAVPDGFEDELYLAVQSQAGLTIVTGCSHRGFENIVEGVAQLFPEMRIVCVAGGLHLLHEKQTAFPSIVQTVRKHAISLIAANHCTGGRAVSFLGKELGDGFVYFDLGDTIEL